MPNLMDVSLTLNLWFVVMLWLLGVVMGLLLASRHHR